MKKHLFFLLAMALSLNSSLAQIRFSSINVDDWIKKNFSGQGVVIGNVKHRGYPLSTLSFTSSGNILQVPKGLILSSGNSFNVAGYNNSHNQSSTFGDINMPQKDDDLAAIVKDKLFDICSVEFDFVPMDNSIQFNYQFGSDEYPEYVGSLYNDVFAFIVSDGLTSKNIALIPGTEVPVSINTVNHQMNSDHFIDNNLYKQVLIKRQEPLKPKLRRTFLGRLWQGFKSLFSYSEPDMDRLVIRADPELLETMDANLYRNLRYDGITKKLLAQMYVVPYKKYHLKIVLADVADNIYDSGVFIEDRSLIAKKDILQPGFTDYPDLRNVIDPNLILQGKTLEEILPDLYKKKVQVSTEPAAAQPERSAGVGDESPLVNAALENAVIYFDFDKSDISASEMVKLKNIMSNFKQLRDQYTFHISGHTDSIGSMQYNMDLSKRRNQAVNNAVNQILNERLRIDAVNKSFTEPAAPNSTDSGRQANRRVEIVFVKKQ